MSLTPPLQELIARHIDSIEALEILLLLHRAPETSMTAAAIDSRLGLKSGIAEKRLQILLRTDLVLRETSGAYRYAVTDEDLNGRVADLASAYADRRTAVVNTVYSENLVRLRAFADAFKVKSE
ncbi:MAG: hypothetical protein ABI718_11045 [Acidobacteriota bacterium]